MLWFCVMVMLRCLSGAPVFLAFPPPPPHLLFALSLPCRLAAVADALLGMVNSDLLLRLLLELGVCPLSMECLVVAPCLFDALVVSLSPC
jgi:hypothetical protein